jgi:hypothetical protein
MEHSLARKVAGVAGLVFVVAILFSAFLPGSPPMADDSTAKVIKYFHDHRDSILFANYLGGIGIVAILVFVAALRNFFRVAEGDLPAPSTLILTGGIAAAAVATIGGIFTTVLAYRIPGSGAAISPLTLGGSLPLVQSLYDLNLYAFTFLSFPLAVLIGGASAAIMRTRALPSWLAMLGFVIVAIQLVAGAAFSTSGFFMPGGGVGFLGFISFLLWVLITSVVLLTRKPAAAAAAAA